MYFYYKIFNVIYKSVHFFFWLLDYNFIKTEFDYKPICNQLAFYVATHKIIYMYYLNKSHDLLNRSCD